MMEFTAETLASWSGGELVGAGRTPVRGFCIDGRRAAPGELFIPLKGDKVDGHDYVAQAVGAGAAGFLAAKWDDGFDALVANGAFALRIDDPLTALQRMAAEHRKNLNVEMVAITGSSGKTTVREMLVAILSGLLRVVASEKNYNNEIGLPLTILRAAPETDVVVVEMGMRGPGQIASLAEIAAPDIGMVTAIGKTHLELLGSEEAIAEAKSELIKVLPKTGVAVLNADDRWIQKLKGVARAKVLTFGVEGGDVRAQEISVGDRGIPAFRIEGMGISQRIELPIPGRHNVRNAVGAALVARVLGARGEDIAAGLASFVLPGMRMELVSTPGGVVVLNDAYNANPDSMRAGLEALADLRTSGRRVAILGDMLELGESSSALHEEVGAEVAMRGIDYLVAVGPLGRSIAEGASKAGMADERIAHFEGVEDATAYIKELVEAGDAVLVKASRGMMLERIASVIP